jgi:hypothetical protein
MNTLIDVYFDKKPTYTTKYEALVLDHNKWFIYYASGPIINSVNKNHWINIRGGKPKIAISDLLNISI